MDDLDEKILSEIQYNFPINVNPYGIIAERIGLSTDELWSRILKLFESGIIRRIGVSLDSRKLGFSSTLAAVRVAPEIVDMASAIINKYHEVTHSYQRKAEYNIWFTLIAENDTRIEEILDEIQIALSLSTSDILNLPVKELFKLDARFKTAKQ